MPQIYSGDEIGMTGGEDPDNRHDFPGGFPGDAHHAFSQDERTATEQNLFAWISGMLALRASLPALKTGLEQNLFADENVFAFVRTLKQGDCLPRYSSTSPAGRFLIVVNKAHQSESLNLPVKNTALAGCTLFEAIAPATGAIPIESEGELHLEIPAESMTVFQVR
jgi:glycosidase